MLHIKSHEKCLFGLTMLFHIHLQGSSTDNWHVTSKKLSFLHLPLGCTKGSRKHSEKGGAGSVISSELDELGQRVIGVTTRQRTGLKQADPVPVRLQHDHLNHVRPTVPVIINSPLAR